MADNPPAFPAFDQAYNKHEMGMTLRDWFAGQIGCGFLSGIIIDGATGVALAEPEVLAARFYRIADAMMTERERDRELQHELEP